MDDRSYADLVAMCQLLPGPASSQVGIAIGLMRGGLRGAILSWCGFTLPSAAALLLFAYLASRADLSQAGWLHGLLIAAVAVVAQAVWGMARNLAKGRARGTIAIVAAVAALLWHSAYGQLLLLAGAGLVGWFILRGDELPASARLLPAIRRRTAMTAWGLFLGLLIGLPILRTVIDSPWLALFDTFYRVGSLVFGGGHVVLPMLQAEVVPAGWMTDGQFLAGYGAAQAVPGPLFTFSAYLGGIAGGWLGALVALTAMFLPSFLLVIGAIPLWEAIRSRPRFQSVLQGIHAAVVGILLAALYDPVWTKAIGSTYDLCLALAAFALLMLWKLPPWAVVLFCAAGGTAISALQ